jgi:hypothetical protein
LLFLPMVGLLSSKRAPDAEASASKLLYRLSDWPWIPDAPTGGSSEDFADAGAAAMNCGAARASANWKQVGLRP